VKKLLIILSLWALAVSGPAAAYEAQTIENQQEICSLQTARAERLKGIPRHLLSAISLAESGRWDERRRANVAWPWTVTSGGQGRFFNTKAEALAEVEFLMTEGVRNIDVGCMQVNLYYHAGAFESLAEALDPEANVTYGASYLKNLYSATGDWTQAAGDYHSTTPELGEPYKAKVLAYWRGQGGVLEAKRAIASTQPPAAIDHQRMARLNTSFRARARSQDAGNQGAGQTKTDALRANAVRQLEGWRNARTRGQGMEHLLAMRRAEQKLNRKREMDRLSKAGGSQSFAQRRAQQLQNWRLRVSGQGGGAQNWRTANAISGEARDQSANRLSATGMAAATARAGAR